MLPEVLKLQLVENKTVVDTCELGTSAFLVVCDQIDKGSASDDGSGKTSYRAQGRTPKRTQTIPKASGSQTSEENTTGIVRGS